ncbi:G-protein coupled receptor 1, partial [Tanacetum coccineum]
DMLCSFFSIVGDPSKGFFCYAQGYSTHFFCVASFLWTTTIAFTLHRTVVRHKADVEDFEPMFHLYVWGTSVVMTVLRSIGNEHGHPGHIGRVAAWCWTETGRTGKASMDWSQLCCKIFSFWSFLPLAVHFFTFYAPLWGAILFNGIVYFQVIRMLNNVTRMAVGMSDRGSQSDTRADMKALNRWGYYPLILIGAWSFGTVNRIHDFIEPGHKIFWLSVLDVGMSALMGLFNSIAYGLNSSVRRAIFERLDLLPESIRRWFPKKLKSRSQQAQHESELVSLKIDEQH